MSKSEKTIIWCDKIMAFSFYALIYFIPISIALSETFTGIALFCYLLKRAVIFFRNLNRRDLKWLSLSYSKNFIIAFIRCFKPIKNSLNTPITVFLVINFISAIFSQHPSVSWEGFLGKSLQSAFLYFNFIECMNSSRRIKIFLKVFFVSCALICINALYQSYIGQDFIHGHYFSGRLSSSLRHPNDFGAYLVIAIPILLCAVYAVAQQHLMLKGQTWISNGVPMLTVKDAVLSFILLCTALYCLGFTYSRGAWIGLIGSMVIIGLNKRMDFLINCLIIILFFNIFYPKMREYRSVELTSDVITKHERHGQEVRKENDVFSQAGSSKEGLETQRKIAKSTPMNGSKSVKSEEAGELFVTENIKEWSSFFKRFGGSGRTGYWEEAVSMIKDYPIFGVGINAYSLVAPRYKINWGGYPHNCYLQMAVEIGVIGLLSFFWIICSIYNTGLKYVKESELKYLSYLLLGGLSGYGGFLIHSFFDTLFYSVQLGSLQWMIMGYIVAISKIETENYDVPLRNAGHVFRFKFLKISKTMLIVCTVIILVFISILCYAKRITRNPKYGLIFYTIGTQCENCPNEKRLRYFQKAVYYDPSFSKAYYQLGAIYEKMGNKEEAIEVYKKSVELSHEIGGSYIRMGQYYYINGELELALRYFHQGYVSNPQEGSINYYLGRIYERKGNYDKAINYYLQVQGRYTRYSVESLARKGAVYFMAGRANYAGDAVVDLRDMGRNDLADQLEEFIRTGKMPEYMSDDHIVNTEF